MNERTIFIAALDIDDPAQRGAYLDESCREDLELRKRVEALIHSHEQAVGFLNAAPPGIETTHVLGNRAVTEAPGDTIGPYKLLQQIGEGGMGVVFMAEQSEPIQRSVWLKIIKPGMDTRQVIARFEAERQAVAMMDHPYIAKVLDAGTTDSGRPYFVMELVKGVPITKYCDEKHLPLRARLELFTQVCQAVQHAHQKGIIHRDIKPNNVLVAEYDNRAVPKVIDFGVAKATAHRLTERTMFTEFGQVLGTMEYMSPEQSKFNQLDIDTRSDIYSLGVLLYELVAGSTPFEGKRLKEAAFDEMLRIIREEEPPKPSTRLSSIDTLPSVAANRQTEPARLSKDVRGELDWIVMKALEKDRSRRYETASGFAADIERHLRDETVAARPASTFYRFRKTIRRNKIAFAAASAVVAALVVGLGFSTWLFVRERAARQRAVAAERLAEIDKQKAKTEAAKSEQVAQFMTHMLQGVGPAVALGRDTTMLREILDQTAERLNELKDQPEVEAHLRTTLGNVYLYLNEDTSAEVMHREALALRRELLGDEHPDVAASLHGLGEALRKQDRFSEAEPLLRQALANRRKLLGEKHPDVALTHFYLGLLFNRQGDGSRAEPFIRQALVLQRNFLNEEHPDIAASLRQLGVALALQGEYEEAEAVSRQALARLKKVLGNDHPSIAYSLHSLGKMLRDQGKLEEAEAMLRQALAMRRKVLGNEHPNVAASLKELAKVLRSQEKLDELDAINREILTIQRKTLGNEHPDVVSSLKELARILRSQGKLDELDAMNREILTIQRKTLGDEHIDVVESLHRLGSVLRAQGELNETEDLFREAVTIRRKLPVDADPSLENTLEECAELLARQRKYAEAAAMDREILTIQRKTLGDEHIEVVKSLHRLGSVLRAHGKLNEAEDSFREALTIRRKLPVDADPRLEHALEGFAELLAQQRKYAEAEALLREAIAIRRTIIGNENPMLAHPLFALSVVLYHRGKLPEAKPLYREAIALLKKGKVEQPNVNPGTMNSLAWNLATHPEPESRDGELAVEIAKQAVELVPDNGMIWNTLGVAHYRTGDWKAAMAALEKSMALRKGGSSEDFFFLAMVHWQLGHQDDAREWYDKAVEWMDNNQPKNEERRRFRAEAAELLGITEPHSSTEPKPAEAVNPNTDNPTPTSPLNSKP